MLVFKQTPAYLAHSLNALSSFIAMRYLIQVIKSFFEYSRNVFLYIY